MEQEISNSCDVLLSGGTILYPTDTLPGLGCDANNIDAVQKIIDIKGRYSDKGFIILLDDDRKLHTYMKEVPDVAWDLIEHSTEPITIIFPNGKNVAPKVLAEDGSIAIRITKDPFCKALVRKFGRAIVSTSANISGGIPAQSIDKIDPTIQNAVDHIVNLPTAQSGKSQPSKIIKLELDGEIRFIRN